MECSVCSGPLAARSAFCLLALDSGTPAGAGEQVKRDILTLFALNVTKMTALVRGHDFSAAPDDGARQDWGSEKQKA